MMDDWSRSAQWLAAIWHRVEAASLESMIARLTTLACWPLLAFTGCPPMTFRNIRQTIANTAYVTNSGSNTVTVLTW